MLKKKYRVDRSIDTFKARLVTKGLNQKADTDYQETYFLVAKFASIRIILAIVAHIDLKLFQMDVNTLLLNED